MYMIEKNPFVIPPLAHNTNRELRPENFSPESRGYIPTRTSQERLNLINKITQHVSHDNLDTAYTQYLHEQLFNACEEFEEIAYHEHDNLYYIDSEVIDIIREFLQSGLDAYRKLNTNLSNQDTTQLQLMRQYAENIIDTLENGLPSNIIRLPFHE